MQARFLQDKYIFNSNELAIYNYHAIILARIIFLPARELLWLPYKKWLLAKIPARKYSSSKSYKKSIVAGILLQEPARYVCKILARLQYFLQEKVLFLHFWILARNM